MSEPPPPPPITSSIVTLDHHQHHHHQHQLPHQQLPPLLQAPQVPQPLTTLTTTPTASHIREYRKGNWTLHETLVLITAKKLDDERRTKASITPPDPTNPNNKQQIQSCRTAELRWKWVENYCWKNGCLRSQNQCNDKWDNLLRDYKKVREYEARSNADNTLPSYWKMEKHQRKERNLPTNLLSEVFQALNEVVHRRYSTPKSLPPLPPTATEPVVVTAIRPQTEQSLPPPPPLPPLPPPPPSQGVSAESSDSSETEGSEKHEEYIERKSRKIRRLGSSIMKSASMLAQTLMTCEEKKEKRHTELMELEQRRLRIEEARNEMNRESMAGLISAVNNLSGAIQAFVPDRNNNGGTGTGNAT